MCAPVCKSSGCASSLPLVNNRCTWYSAALATALYLLNGISLVGPFSALRKGQGFGEMHALFFDAGSTGTRLHVFTFYNHSDGKLELRKENYFHTQPGLSSFANNPHKVRTSVKYLLNEAQNIIPGENWQNTPVALKATAGLRLLPQKKSDLILQEVRNALIDAELKIDDDNDVVSIMDGEDEGYFAWYTVNFLLGSLNNPANSVTVLDLGGGSTQVAFQPVDPDTLSLSPKSHITTKNVLGKPATLYVHSYLGLGLMSARLGILQSTTDLTGKGNILTTPCFYPNTSRTWNIHGNEYFVKSMESQIPSYSACYQQAKDFVTGKMFSPKEIKTRRVYGLSYYFDRAADAGLIDRVYGGTILLSDLFRASEDVCSRYVEDKLFLCLDLTYITTLIHYGLGLDVDKEITLAKKIDSVEASWVLGAAFSHLR